MELYRHAKVTRARGADLAGLALETCKERLAEAQVPIRRDESPEEIRAGADLIDRLRKVQ